MATNKQVAEMQVELRAQYMNGLISHQDYYLWLAKMLHIAWNEDSTMAARVLASTDPHYNDIPLSEWDSYHPWMSVAASRLGLPWSMSDTVCVQKAAAREYVEAAMGRG